MVDDVPVADSTSMAAFLAIEGVRLERALVARFGFEIGREAAADVAAYAVAHWHRLSGLENPTGYLFRVGQTSARRQRRWTRPPLVHPDPITTPQPINLDLQRALMCLRPEQRVAVLLTRGFSYSHAEVAELLDCTVSSIGNHVTRGLAQLRKLMSE